MHDSAAPTPALSVLDDYDALLLDLDGTVFAGNNPIDGAEEAIVGRRVMYVTNNASRSPAQVAVHLNGLGFPAEPQSVLTSAEAACAAGRDLCEQRGLTFSSQPDANPRAFVVGTASFRHLAESAGFTIVNSAADEPHIVFQGHDPENTWARLSEAALAIRSGALYVASNLDTTLPSERGLLVGNGSMVAAVVSATGVQPVSTGKPEPTMFTIAARRAGARNPLVIGDRLDTDIAGGIAAGYDTMLTLTGVSGHWDVLATTWRPKHIVFNLRDELPRWGAAEVRSGVVELRSDGAGGAADDFSDTQREIFAAAAVKAVAPVVWSIIDRRMAENAGAQTAHARSVALQQITIRGADPVAEAAIDAWR